MEIVRHVLEGILIDHIRTQYACILPACVLYAIFISDQRASHCIVQPPYGITVCYFCVAATFTVGDVWRTQYISGHSVRRTSESRLEELLLG